MIDVIVHYNEALFSSVLLCSDAPVKVIGLFELSSFSFLTRRQISRTECYGS